MSARGGRRPGTRFLDRADAGRNLAASLVSHGLADPVAIGLARGGVRVAAEIARELGCPLDALAVRKIGHPAQPEYAIGAVTAGGGTYLRGEAGLGAAEVEVAAEQARIAADELDLRLHEGRGAHSLAERTALLVDDGLATGATMIAAVDWARRGGAARVVVAVPVGPSSSVEELRRVADDVVCLHEYDELFGSVGAWYEDFSQLTDDEVVALMDELGTATGGEEAGHDP